MSGSTRRLGLPFWLALACSGLVFVLWAIDARRDSSVNRELESRKAYLEIDIRKCLNLAKLRTEREREIRSLEDQLLQLDRMTPPSAKHAARILERDIEDSGLSLTGLETIERTESRYASHDWSVIRMQLAAGWDSWWNTLERIDSWPIMLVTRRLEVADPRNPEATMTLDAIVIMRHPSDEATTDD